MKHYTLKLEEFELLTVLRALNAKQQKHLDIFNDQKNAPEVRNHANSRSKEYLRLANELITQKNSRFQP